MKKWIVVTDGDDNEIHYPIRLIECKDCKNPQFGIDVAFCEVVGRIIHPNDYCCWAERRKE